MCCLYWENYDEWHINTRVRANVRHSRKMRQKVLCGEKKIHLVRHANETVANKPGTRGKWSLWKNTYTDSGNYKVTRSGKSMTAIPIELFDNWLIDRSPCSVYGQTIAWLCRLNKMLQFRHSFASSVQFVYIWQPTTDGTVAKGTASIVAILWNLTPFSFITVTQQPTDRSV